MASEVADIEGIVVDEQDATQDSRIVAVEPFASEDAFEVVVFAVVVALGYGSTTAVVPLRIFRCDEVLPSGAEGRVHIAQG